MIITALASTLLWNVSYAGSEQKITCKTGFFSSKTLIVLRYSYIHNDSDAEQFVADPADENGYAYLMEEGVFLDFDYEFVSNNYQKTSLLSDSRKHLNAFGKYYIDGRHPKSTFQEFKWQEGDLAYQLWDSDRGWALRIEEKDWSSSEGNHYDTVLNHTYCREGAN